MYTEKNYELRVEISRAQVKLVKHTSEGKQRFYQLEKKVNILIYWWCCWVYLLVYFGSDCSEYYYRPNNLSTYELHSLIISTFYHFEWSVEAPVRSLSLLCFKIALSWKSNGAIVFVTIIKCSFKIYEEKKRKSF